MNTLILVGCIFICIGVSLLIVGATLTHYAQTIVFGMPYMRWMTLDEIVAIGCPKLITKVIVFLLAHAEAIEVRLTEEYEQELIEEALDSSDPAEEGDLEVHVQFEFRDMAHYEYRIKFRPRRKRNVWRTRTDDATDGVLVLA